MEGLLQILNVNGNYAPYSTRRYYITKWAGAEYLFNIIVI